MVSMYFSSSPPCSSFSSILNAPYLIEQLISSENMPPVLGQITEKLKFLQSQINLPLSDFNLMPFNINLQIIDP